ncbi:MAG: SMEK domain-containing protein [Halomonas sp.]|uniref:SMEK domain-containing protein n=1 Tax=Halomonas sp. TaxID=1486246 RepID=UPI002ACDBE39|nr:SMEK domain-containing protein [Halomonas sp.]MDZ7854205.1 SMEK domain-containing protein [Halomonas sp.]
MQRSHHDFIGMTMAEYADALCDILKNHGESIRSSNARGLTDKAKHAEYFYIGILNHLYGYNLYNMNDRYGSFSAGIDLLDASGKIAYQITSQPPNNHKVKDSLSRTAEAKRKNKEGYKKINHLTVLFICDTSAPPPQTKSIEVLAQESGIEVEVATIHNLQTRCRDLLSDQAAPSYAAITPNLRRAFHHAMNFLHPEKYITHEIKRVEYNKAVSFLDGIKDIDINLAFYYRLSKRHRHQLQQSSPSWLNFKAKTLREELFEKYKEDGAEGLAEKSEFIRFWGVSSKFFDRLINHLNSWYHPLSRQSTLLERNGIIELAILEDRIFEVARRIQNFKEEMSANLIGLDYNLLKRKIQLGFTKTILRSHHPYQQADSNVNYEILVIDNSGPFGKIFNPHGENLDEAVKSRIPCEFAYLYGKAVELDRMIFQLSMLIDDYREMLNEIRQADTPLT